MFILSHHQVLPTLSQFIEVENIPKKYGGLLNFESGDMPNLDPDLRECLTISPGKDTERYFLTAPVRWIDAGDDGEMIAVGVGSIDGKQRQEHVATLHSLATRVATREGRLSRVPTQQSQAYAPVAEANHVISHVQNPLPMSHEPPAAQVVSNTQEPSPTPMMNGAGLNGGPPEKVSLPSRPVGLGRQETEYVTPPSDPSEIKLLA